MVGSPDLVGEVAARSTAIDLGSKLDAYRRNNIQEYIVWRVLDNAVDWFALCQAEYAPLPLDKNGWYRSEVFPGCGSTRRRLSKETCLLSSMCFSKVSPALSTPPSSNCSRSDEQLTSLLEHPDPVVSASNRSKWAATPAGVGSRI